MKKIVLIVVIIALAAFLYISLRPDNKQTVSYNRTDDEVEQSAAPAKDNEAAQIINTGESQAPASPTSVPNSGNRSPETGWTAFPGVPEPQPKIDVSAQINVGNGFVEPKTIKAKQGQRVSIMFTATIRDLAKIQGYNAETYIEPQRESAIGFTVDKAGDFPIILTKLNKTIGTLKVE